MARPAVRLAVALVMLGGAVFLLPSLVFLVPLSVYAWIDTHEFFQTHAVRVLASPAIVRWSEDGPSPTPHAGERQCLKTTERFVRRAPNLYFNRPGDWPAGRVPRCGDYLVVDDPLAGETEATGPYLPPGCDAVIYNHVWRRLGRGRVFVARLPGPWQPDPLDNESLPEADLRLIEAEAERVGLLRDREDREERVAWPRIGGLHAPSVEAALNGAMSGVGFERVSTTQCQGFELIEMRAYPRGRGGKRNFVREMGYSSPAL